MEGGSWRTHEEPSASRSSASKRCLATLGATCLCPLVCIYKETHTTKHVSMCIYIHIHIHIWVYEYVYMY